MLLPEEADPRKSKLLHGDADEGWNLRSKFSPRGLPNSVVYRGVEFAKQILPRAISQTRFYQLKNDLPRNVCGLGGHVGSRTSTPQGKQM